MMVGVMLVAGSKRHVLVIDGMAACAALMVASRIAPAVTDYCVFSRSHAHPGLDHALALFSASALLELGMDSIDGTGATLAWPLIVSAAALLTEVAEGEDPGPTLPNDMTAAGEPNGEEAAGSDGFVNSAPSALSAASAADLTASPFQSALQSPSAAAANSEPSLV
jgi:hypothetical protein